MRIGFDAKRIVKNATGLGNYSRYIINSLVEYYPGNDYLLYAPEKGNESLKQRVANHPGVSFLYPETFLSKKFPSYWRSYSIGDDLLANKVDLFHGLSNEIPFTLKKKEILSVVTIHDLIFLTLPQCYHSWDRKIYDYKYGKSALLADTVIAISECTKRDIVRFWGVPESKIEVVYQGCDESFKRKIGEEERKKLFEKYKIDGPYILYVGSIEERKNLLLLTQALKQLTEDIKVIAIGRVTPYAEKVNQYIQENGLQDRVRMLHNVPFGDLPAFYQCAQLFVYPSFYEGFGIPMIEALQSGIPAIGATGSCLEEAGGPDSLYTDPTNPNELKNLIKEVLTEPSLREKMITNGFQYIKQFSSSYTTTALMEVYEKTYKK